MLRFAKFGWCVVAFVAFSLSGCRHMALPSTPATGTTASREDKPEAAAEKIAQAHAHYAAGVIHEMNDETEAAMKEYYEAALKDPDNEWLVLDLSRRFLASKQPEKAIDLLTRATARPRASGALFAQLGAIYAQQGNPDRAIQANRAAINRAPASLAGYHNLFLSYLQAKQREQALQVLDEAAHQPNAGPEFLVSLSELYAAFGLQFSDLKDASNSHALGVLTRAEELKPSDPAIRFRLADGFSAAGKPAKAAQIYLELLKQGTNDPLLRERLHARLAAIYLRGSDNKQAIEQLEEMLRDDPTNPQAYFYLGRLAYEDKRPADASDYFRKAVLLAPEFREAWYYLSVSLLGANKTSEALATLEKAREKFPQSFDLELWTGLAYMQQKGYTEAISHLTAAEVVARATDPALLTHEFYFQFGSACERSGDLIQAGQYFEKCLKLKSDFPPALNYLGYMWAEHGTNLDQARELIETAVKAEPTNAAYLDSMGWVLFKLNQSDKALEYILKAVDLNKEPDPTLYDHLGDIYAALGQREKAHEAWKKSIGLEPNEEVRKKLEAGGSH